MQQAGSILVVITPKQPEQLSIKRAKLIASVTRSHLHLLVCDKQNQHSDLLAEISQKLQGEGFSVSSEQSWRNSYHETIIQAQQEKNCSLVIKQHYSENPLKRALLTPDDWKLLRSCPCPVLITKTNRPWTGANILAAVDVGNSGAEHQALHASLIENAHAIANIANAKLHVFTAHPAPMLSAADPAFQLRDTIEARYREKAASFVSQYGLADEQMHIKEGPADVLIPKVAKELDAAVTIIGTVARTGLSGALIGNTAEAVLEAIDTDVIVVKPQQVSEYLQSLLQS